MITDLRPPAMEPAELIWQDGVPESARFGDVYFSRDDGLAETRYVFIERNGLPAQQGWGYFWEIFYGSISNYYLGRNIDSFKKSEKSFKRDFWLLRR